MSRARTTRKPATAPPPGSQDETLGRQYGGLHTGKWVATIVPASWIPYVQLARLSPPAGVCLVLFPHLFGLFHASILQPQPLGQSLWVGALVVAGSFFLSNSYHGWNDLIDAPIDKLVARTNNRPIVRGVVSPRGALIFTASQALAAAAVLLVLPRSTMFTAIPSMVVNFYYPWSKRHTHAAQFVLGVSLGWGVNVGTAAMGIVPWERDFLASTTCLFASSALWTVIYDTIYAFQDIADDSRIGLKSTAVFFREYTKPFLWICLGALLSLLSTHGYLVHSGFGYFGIAVGGCGASLGSMLANVDLKDPSSCWWWFRYGFWFAGSSITAGLLWQSYFGRYA